MLLIRAEQMHTLAEDVERRFRQEVVGIVRTTYPEMPDLECRVNDAIDRAETYAFVRKEDVLWFVHLDLLRGAAWETLPGMEWAMQIVNAPGTDVAGRRFRLEKRLQRWDEHGYECNQQGSSSVRG